MLSFYLIVSSKTAAKQSSHNPDHLLFAKKRIFICVKVGTEIWLLKVKKLINGINNVSGSVKLGLQKTSRNFLSDDLFPSIVSSMVAEQ